MPHCFFLFEPEQYQLSGASHLEVSESPFSVACCETGLDELSILLPDEVDHGSLLLVCWCRLSALGGRGRRDAGVKRNVNQVS